MLTRLVRAAPEHVSRGQTVISIFALSCSAFRQVISRALPYIGLALISTIIAFAAMNQTGSAMVGMFGYVLMAIGFWSAMLAAFWIQWSAATLSGVDREYEQRWQFLPPRVWLEKVAPLAFVLAVGLALLIPFGKALWDGSTFSAVVWPLLVTTLAMIGLLATTGVSGVAAAQEIDADMSGYGVDSGKLLLLGCLISVTSLTIVTVLIGPVFFLVAAFIGLGGGWTAPVLLSCHIVFVWTVASTAAGVLLEERLWHTEFYN